MGLNGASFVLGVRPNPLIFKKLNEKIQRG